MTEQPSPDDERSHDSESLDLESKLDDLWSDQGDRNATAQTGVVSGQLVGPYQVRAFLGAGSFGLVYLADDVDSGQPVALKLPRIEVLLDKEKQKRFRVEAEIIGRLDHPGIVRILRSDVDEEAMPYIACDWCTGPDVAAYLHELRTAKKQTLPTWQESVRLMAKVCDAIHFAHEQGVTHRDIKPANVILHLELTEDESEQGSVQGLDRFHPRITDFGLARLADPVETTTRTGVVLGTPAYMAPERILAGLAGGDAQMPTHDCAIKSDIYSLGAVLFEMLTGDPPAKSNSWLELIRRERSSSQTSGLQWPKEVPVPLRKVVETCLRQDPRIRYETADDVGNDLRRLLKGEAPVGRPIGILKRLGLRFSAQDWMATAGWFAIVSQSIVAAWLIVGDAFKVPFEVLTISQYFNMLPMLLFVALVSSVSVVVAGFCCVKRKWWAPYVGASLVFFNLYAPAMALAGKPMMFTEIYEANTPYLSFMIHLIIAITFSLQLVLFVCAIGEHRLKRKK